MLDRQTLQLDRHTHIKKWLQRERPIDRQAAMLLSADLLSAAGRLSLNKNVVVWLFVLHHIFLINNHKQLFFRKQEYLELGRILFSKISSVYLSVYLVLQSETLALFWNENSTFSDVKYFLLNQSHIKLQLVPWSTMLSKASQGSRPSPSLSSSPTGKPVPSNSKLVSPLKSISVATSSLQTQVGTGGQDYICQTIVWSKNVFVKQ